MQNLTLERKIHVRYSDIECNARLKPFALLNFFQDMAAESAEQLGFGYSTIYPQNLMWVLLKYRIEFTQYPTHADQLTIKTQPRGYNRLFAYRDFEVYAGGELCGRASSVWALVNSQTLDIAHVADVLKDNPNMIKFVPNETDLKFSKIPPLTQTDYEETFKVRYNDIDINMHANNGNYIVWALEPLPYEWKHEKKLKNIDIVFKKEIKCGEQLTCKVQKLDEHTTLHALLHTQTQEELCTVKCQWA
ncbi:MAG: hypothetical protein IKP06_05225 [Elusimicrobiaceae bacterium]|nr:hypothetical protein [Elusimicrobiaceae bacterium]